MLKNATWNLIKCDSRNLLWIWRKLTTNTAQADCVVLDRKRKKRVLWYQLWDWKTLPTFRLNASVFIRTKVFGSSAITTTKLGYLCNECNTTTESSTSTGIDLTCGKQSHNLFCLHNLRSKFLHSGRVQGHIRQCPLHSWSQHSQGHRHKCSYHLCSMD